MFDSVKLNSLVSSASLVEYNQLLGNKTVKAEKVNSAKKTFESKDVEGVIELQDTSTADKGNKQKLTVLANQMTENFSKEAEYNIAYKCKELSNVTWENDTRIQGLQKEMQQDVARYKSIINSAVNKFLAQYSGDGSDLEAKFAEFITDLLKNDDSLKALVQKYNNEGIADNEQKEMDEAKRKLAQLEASGKNDKQTQAMKQYLEMTINNAQIFVKNPPVTTGGINTKIDTDLYSIENIFAEVASTVDWEKIDIEKYRSNPKFVQAQEMLVGLRYNANPDSVIESVKAILTKMLNG